MSDYSATIQVVGVGPDRHAVVLRAEDTIWIADDLMHEAQDPNQQRITGGLEIDGERLTFGTPGEGMGRLTYRITGQHRDNFGTHWTVAEREP